MSVKKSQLMISPTLKRIMYSVFLGLFITGLFWLYLDVKFPDLMPDKKFLLLKIHGALAMCSLIIVGWMIPEHVLIGLKGKRNKPTGYVMIAACLGLIISGYGLYYFGDETARHSAIWVHNTIGIAAPLLLFFHIIFGRLKR